MKYKKAVGLTFLSLILVLICSAVCSVENLEEVDYSKELKGKFILKGAEYAGFNFIDSKTITWTNEMFPNDPDILRLKWVDKNTFIATYTKSINKDCPPRNLVCGVESYDGKKLVLKSFWTGWNDYKDEIQIFYKK